MVQFDLLGLDEHAQFLVGEHGNRSQNCAFDEIERQNAKQQIALHAGHIRVDSIARIKDSLQRHNLRIKRNDEKIVGQHADTGHSDRSGCTAEDSHLAALVSAVQQHGDNNERGKHQEICNLTGAAGLGLGQMNNVLDADHRDRRSDAEDKRADEHDRAGQIHLEKRRHERNRKLKVHQYGCDSRKNCGVGDFAGFCHCCFFSLSGVLFHK